MVSPREIISSCLGLVPVPGLQPAFTVFLAVWDAAQAVRDMREQVETLAGEVAELLCTLDTEVRTGRLDLPPLDESGNLPPNHEGRRGSAELANLYKLLVEIEEFVKLQASYNLFKILYRHSDSTKAIEIFQRRIRSILRSFKISTLSKLQDWQALNAEARIKDQESLNEKLNNLEKNQYKLAEQLDLQHSSVMAMMVSLKKSLETRLVKNPQQRKFLTHSLKYLSSISGEQVQVDSWTITSFEVEFGTQIGGGGFGQVFQGTWNKTPVALKVLKDRDAIPSASAVRSEIEAWSDFRHPHVLQFLGANVFDDRPFIVMPYVKNGNARDYCRTHPDCDRVKILHHITLGLVYLHSKRVIHGDLKGLNVLIDDGEKALLCDFGLSRVKADATSRSTAHGGSDNSVVGSRNWMSPERLLGGALRKPVDIYAFGMTIYEIYTSDVPLGSLSHIPYTGYIDLVVEKGVRPERPDEDEIPAFPDELWELAEQCWVRNPKSRPDAMSVCETVSHCIAQNRNQNFGSQSNTSTEDWSTSSVPFRVDTSASNEEPAPQTPIPPSSIPLVLPIPPSPDLPSSLTTRKRSLSHPRTNPPPLPAPQTVLAPSVKVSSPARSRASSTSQPSLFGSEVGGNASLAPHSEPASEMSVSLDRKISDDISCNLVPYAEGSPCGVAEVCLDRMNKSLRHNICRLPTTFHLDRQINNLSQQLIEERISMDLQHAVVNWTEHILEVQHLTDRLLKKLHELLFKHLLHWIEVLSLIGCLDENKVCSSLHLVDEHISSQVEDGSHSKLCRMIKDAISFLHSYSYTISQAHLHTYISALPQFPSNTLLFQTYITEVTDKRPHFSSNIIRVDPLSPFKHHRDEIGDITMSPNGSRLIACGGGKVVRIYDEMTGEEVRMMKGHSDFVRCAVFSHDGQRLASCSNDKTICVWNVQTGQLLKRLAGHEGQVFRAEFSRDDSKLVSCSVWNIITWNVNNGDLIGRQEMQESTRERLMEFYTSATFSPDGQQVAITSSDHTIEIWDSKLENQVAVIDHKVPVNSVVWSLNGSKLASISKTWNRISLWDAKQISQNAIFQTDIHSSAFTILRFVFTANQLCLVSDHSGVVFLDTWNIDTANYDRVTKIIARRRDVTRANVRLDLGRVVAGTHHGEILMWDIDSLSTYSPGYIKNLHKPDTIAFHEPFDTLKLAHHTDAEGWVCTQDGQKIICVPKRKKSPYTLKRSTGKLEFLNHKGNTKLVIRLLLSNSCVSRPKYLNVLAPHPPYNYPIRLPFEH